ncbi:WXG100 family type VII secretion target [Lentzea sp. JNUCC 0626]|uniref:WXG100 family type VII secretion target n=1 Tax=Lentzea sp. JNUCC 0626 TaxID=3367513 RepID=UPI003748035A
MKYDKDAIAAFAEVFDAAREQVEEIRSSMMKPELTETDLGESWHAEGTEFVRQFDRIDLDLGDLADVLEHLRTTMVESAETMVGADDAQRVRMDAVHRPGQG